MQARHSTSIDPVNANASRLQLACRNAWRTLRREGVYQGNHIARFRLRQLERLFHRRCGFTLPDDDDGRDSLELVAHHIAFLRGEVEKHIVAWASLWCPWMPRAEAEALAKRVASRPVKFKASTLGWRLRLTELERTELAITTIRAFNMTDEQMIERRRQRDRERKARRRLAKRTRMPAPLNQTMPWKGAGISRATWYRRRKAAVETKSVRSWGDLIAADGICLTAHGHRASKVLRGSTALPQRHSLDLPGLGLTTSRQTGSNADAKPCRPTHASPPSAASRWTALPNDRVARN
jgi:hypothetical protein